MRSRRVGGATYQVPVEVRRRAGSSLAHALAGAVRARRAARSPWSAELAGEILDAAANRGGAVKKKEDTHRMAEANKAFAHYRW